MPGMSRLPRPPKPAEERPRPRVWARRASAVVLTAGVLVAVDGVTALVWQEPVTALLQHRRQAGLQERFAALPTPALPVVASPRGGRHAGAHADRRAGLAALARATRSASRLGDPVARLVIPRAGVDQIVVVGTAGAQLAAGPGLYRDQPYPGAGGTAAIAGHRTTFGAPFRHLDDLRPGDPIRLTLAYGRLTYRTVGLTRVGPDDVSILRPTGRELLVLSTCDPPFSSARRLIVRARLVRTAARPADPAAGRSAPGRAASASR